MASLCDSFACTPLSIMLKIPSFNFFIFTNCVRNDRQKSVILYGARVKKLQSLKFVYHSAN